MHSNRMKKKIISFKNYAEKKNIAHKSFEIGILIKGIDGVLEIIGGALLIFLNPSRLSKITVLLTQGELSEDPKDVVANFIVKFSRTFTISSQYFGVFYLISHGIVKIILVLLLWKKKSWAYPLAIISLILFIIYQLYRYTINNSISMLLLTIFDIIMIILTLIEYKNIIRK